jgi:hypothetical protein
MQIYTLVEFEKQSLAMLNPCNPYDIGLSE